MSQKTYSPRVWIAICLMIASVAVGIFAGFFMFIPPPGIPSARLVTPPSPPAQTVDFIAVGDIMLSRNVARYAQKSGTQNWNWEHIGTFLRGSDFVFWNLEWTTNGTSVYSYQKVLIFNALPELIRTLPGVNFAVLNLANNHALDQGDAGLATTQELLTDIGIYYVGTWATFEEAWQPKIIERNGIKIAFIGASYAAYNDNGAGNNPKIARMQDTKSLVSAVQKAKSLADFVVVTMHAGTEYTREPTKLQTSFSHTAIDAGADIVLGAHPHWTQGIESYRGKYILYSLGNFVFDQDFSPETKTGLAVRVSLQKELWSTTIHRITLHPVLIENYGQPRLLVWEAKTKALTDIGQTRDVLE